MLPNNYSRSGVGSLGSRPNNVGNSHYPSSGYGRSGGIGAASTNLGNTFPKREERKTGLRDKSKDETKGRTGYKVNTPGAMSG